MLWNQENPDARLRAVQPLFAESDVDRKRGKVPIERLT